MKKVSTGRLPGKYLVIAGILVIVYIASLFVRPISAFTRYPVMVVKCGRMPIIGQPPIFGVRTYLTPGNSAYNISFLNDPDNYFCTEYDAQRAGFSPDKSEIASPLNDS